MSKALELAKFGRETPPTGVVVGDSDAQTLSSKTFSDGPVFSGLNANGVPFLNASKVLSSSSTFVFDGTNIGLGIASPAATLHVNASGGGTIRASRSSVGGEYVQLDHDGTDGTLRVSGNNKLYLATNGTTRVTVLGGGNVGVGIQAPTAILHTQSSGLGDGGGIKIGNSGSGGGTFAVWPTATINSEGANKLIFTGSGGNLVTITGAGNLGIGTTDPTYKLQVAGDTYVTGKFLQSNLASYPEQYLSFTVGTSTWIKLFTITSPGNCRVKYRTGSNNSEEQGEFTIRGTYASSEVQLTWSRQTYNANLSEIRVTSSNGAPFVVWALLRTTEFPPFFAWQVIEAVNTVTLHNSTGETPGSASASINTPTWNGTASTHDAVFNRYVGIGTYLPQEKLHVQGKMRLFDGGYPYIDLGVATNNYFRFIHDNPNDRLNIGKNSAIAMSIDGSNYVHFYAQGVAGAGAVNLTSADPFIRLTATGGTANKQKWDIRAISVTGSEALEFRTINDANNVFSTKFWIGNNGNIGIGTTAPQAQLHIGTGWIGIHSDITTSTAVPAWSTARITGEIHANSGVGSGSDGGLLRLSAGGETSANGGQKAGIDISGYNTTDQAPTLRFYSGIERMRIQGNNAVQLKMTRTSSTSGVALLLSDNVTGGQTDGVYKSIRSGSNGDNSVSEIRFVETDGTNNNTAIAFATQNTAGGLTERMRISPEGIVSVNGVNVARIQTDILAMWRTSDLEGRVTQASDGGSVSYSWDNGVVRVDSSVGSHNWDIGKVRLPAGSYQIVVVYRPSPTAHGWTNWGSNSNGHAIRLQTDAEWGSFNTLTSVSAPAINKDLGYSITYISGVATIASDSTLRIGMGTDPYSGGGYKYYIEAAYIIRVR